MTEPIRMTYISAVISLDLHTLQEEKVFPLLKEKTCVAGGEDPSVQALGGRPPMTDPDRIFLPCFQVRAFLFYSRGRSRRQLALLALPIGPAAVYLFVYLFIILSSTVRLCSWI